MNGYSPAVNSLTYSVELDRPDFQITIFTDNLKHCPVFSIYEPETVSSYITNIRCYGVPRL